MEIKRDGVLSPLSQERRKDSGINDCLEDGGHAGIITIT